LILHCNFEELAAVTAGARHCLAVAAGGVASQPALDVVLDDVDALLPRLTGDISIQSLEEQESVERALIHITEQLRERMDQILLEQFVGAEDAVAAYFDYAHVLTVNERVRLMGIEMAALAELLTGQPVAAEAARNMHFPD
jgi:hypothetical protein